VTRPVQVTVLGSGSWGTTVASLAAANTPTRIWARHTETAKEIDGEHTNRAYLGDRALHPDLAGTPDLEEAVGTADVLVVGVPSHGIRTVLTDAAGYVRPWIPVLSLAKGLEPETRLRPTEVISGCLPGHSVGLLAGPNIAGEVADGLAAAAVVAISDAAVATALQPIFASRVFRVYRNTDLLGAELGGVLKNIVAIAAGMADGLGVGVNTRATVVARGLAEITRLGVAMGAQASTFAGLTGLGDLMATCMSPDSRNRRFGERLARGETPREILAETNQVAEGVKTAHSVLELAEAHDVAVPICAEVEAVVNSGRTPAQAYRGLRKMGTGSEHEAG
jgi:glycerol-3-phosphate dehydrogenase (NAD(P)+)